MERRDSSNTGWEERGGKSLADEQELDSGGTKKETLVKLLGGAAVCSEARTHISLRRTH